jgi:tetratricopeptide (TPR) repeat protein
VNPNGVAPPPGCRLLVVGGNDRGKELRLTGADITIGRGIDQSFVMADIAVSRRHVRVRWDGKSFLLKDLGSGNGSFVNGQKVNRVELHDGDQIEIGNTLLRFENPAKRRMAATSTVSPPAGTGPRAGHPPADGRASRHESRPGRQSLREIVGDTLDPQAGSQPLLPVVGLPQRDTLPPGSQNRANGGLHPDEPPVLRPVGGPSFLSHALARLRLADAARRSALGQVVTLGAMLAVLGLLGWGVSRLVRSTTTPATTSPRGPSVEALFADGVRLLHDRRWADAKLKFEEVLLRIPDSEQARKYGDRIDAEVRAEESLARAKRAMGDGDMASARRAVASIGPDSSYRAEADQLARRLVPTDDATEGGTVGDGAVPAGRPTVGSAKEGARLALAAYRERRFDQAAAFYMAAAEQLPSRRRGAMLLKAKQVRRMETLWGEGERLLKTAPVAAAGALEQALELDRALGGAHTNPVGELLGRAQVLAADVLVAKARAAARTNAREARRLVNRALQLAPKGSNTHRKAAALASSLRSR